VARDLSELATRLSTSGVHVAKRDEPSRSHFGGDPKLPKGVQWPRRNGRPLTFLVRLSLDELQLAHRIDWLPEHGALLVFYDTEEQPWGFDPKDRGGCAVLFVPDLSADTVPSPNAGAGEALPPCNMGFRRIDTLPSTDREPLWSLKLNLEEMDAYYKLRDAPFAGLPAHQVAGFPSPVQGDEMQLECQLVSNGLYCGDERGRRDERAAGLRAGAASWRLLLQLDHDEDLEVMWGDCGMLYFWVEEESARAGSFDNVWVILQC
jgi:Domain of unknown function (DUF1963)